MKLMLYAGLVACLVGACPASGRAQNHADHEFHAMQQRGRAVMGVDQYTSTHVFDDLPDGGRIELQTDSAHAADANAIRAHLKNISAAFSEGDFTAPGLVHMKDVPGTKVMAERRDHIRYTYKELPRGGELRITTTDSASIRAIHDFLAFQRSEHHAGGMHH